MHVNSTQIKELYGNIRRFKCVNSSHANPNSDSDTLPLMPPQCIHIGCDRYIYIHIHIFNLIYDTEI